MEYTFEELREMADLTSAIAANLRATEECAHTEDDLNEMAQTRNTISANLNCIADCDECELAATLETTNAIVANLEAIEESK